MATDVVVVVVVVVCVVVVVVVVCGGGGGGGGLQWVGHRGWCQATLGWSQKVGARPQ